MFCHMQFIYAQFSFSFRHHALFECRDSAQPRISSRDGGEAVWLGLASSPTVCWRPFRFVRPHQRLIHYGNGVFGQITVYMVSFQARFSSPREECMSMARILPRSTRLKFGTSLKKFARALYETWLCRVICLLNSWKKEKNTFKSYSLFQPNDLNTGTKRKINWMTAEIWVPVIPSNPRD